MKLALCKKQLGYPEFFALSYVANEAFIAHVRSANLALALTETIVGNKDRFDEFYNAARRVRNVVFAISISKEA